MAEMDVMIARIRKLLAKAERTSSEAEAAAFSAKAAELLATHRIDAARLADHGGDGHELVVERIEVGRGAYVRARLALLQAVADANECALAFSAGETATIAHLAGTRDDTRAVAVLYHALHAQAAEHMARVRRSSAAATQRWRRAFLFGFADRVATMLAAAHDAALSATPHADGVALRRSIEVELASKAARAQRHLVEAVGPVRAARRPGAAPAGGWADGHAAAATADVGRRRLSARPALGRGVA